MNENDLYNELTSDVDSLEYAEGAPVVSSGVGVGASRVKGNPAFVSQFDINLTPKYYSLALTRTLASDSWDVARTVLAPSALPADLKTDVAAFVFGKADAVGGYKRNHQLFPVSNWIYKVNKLLESDTPAYSFNVNAVAGKVDIVSIESPSFLDGVAGRGDILQVYYRIETGATTTAVTITLCEVRIECKQVAYGTLLDATSSDRFTINNIRYKVPDSTKTAQFEKQFRLIRQSLFGKLSTDDLSPAAYQKPEQFQVNIIDVPIIKGIDKESSIGTYLNYDVGEVLWSIFVQTQRKVTEKIG